MNLTTWLAVVSICMLGAMSPGPSLAVVLRHTLAAGQRAGYSAAVAHGMGIGLYALACISGIAFLITASPVAFNGLQWLGAAYLAWLGWKGLTASPASETERPGERMNGATEQQQGPLLAAARDGFMVVFLNPKVAVFFIALFSQVIGPNTPLSGRLGYAATAMAIDVGWYLLVAWLFSRPLWLDKLQNHSLWLERLFGLILLLLAVRLVYQNLA